MTEPIAFLDGEIVPISQARLHVFDLGVVGGAAVTEMIRTFAHQPFRLDDHLCRLDASLAAVGFSPPYSTARIRNLVTEVVQRNTALIGPASDLGIIVFVTAGWNPTYIGRSAALERGPSLGIHTFELPRELWRDKYTTGVSLTVPGVRNLPPDVIPPTIKHRSRLHWWLADRAARQIDPQSSALVLDQRGLISETAAGNVCLVRDGTIISPAPEFVLEGVSLQVVSELCQKIGMPFERADLTVNEALAAEECFVTSTPPCLLPVTRINGQPIGTGQPGPMISRLLAAWSDLVGVDIVAQMQMPR